MADIPAPPPGFQIEGQPNPDAAVGNIATLQNIHNQLQGMDPQERIKAFAALPPAVQQGIQRMVVQQASTPEARAERFKQIQDQNVADMPWYERARAGFGKAFVDTGRGLGELVGLESPQDIANARQNDQALMDSGWGKAGDFAGQAAQFIGAGGIAGTALKGATALGAATPYIADALGSAAVSGAQPVAGDESRGVNAAIGAGAGAAGRAVSPVLDYLGMKAAPVVSDAKQAGIDLAKQYGIPLHLSQVSDSLPLKVIASTTKYLPFAGTAKAAAAQQGAFNRALSNQIGENASSLSDEVLGNAASKIGQGYNDLFARNNVKFDPQTVSKLGSLWQQAGKDLTPDQAQVVQNQITKYFEAAQANGGQIPGRLYQNIRTELQNIEGGNAPATHLVGQVRKTMQDAADKSFAGDDAAALKKLNGQYNSLKILQKGVDKRAAGASGDIAPANLWGLVNGKYGSTPEMRDLARLGQTVLKDRIPDSGTPVRMLGYGAMGAGGFAAPHSVLPLVASGMTLGRALNSPYVANTLPYLGQNALGLLAKGARPIPYIAPVIAEDAQR